MKRSFYKTLLDPNSYVSGGLDPNPHSIFGSNDIKIVIIFVNSNKDLMFLQFRPVSSSKYIGS